jgi:hypothetical protein
MLAAMSCAGVVDATSPPIRQSAAKAGNAAAHLVEAHSAAQVRSSVTRTWRPGAACSAPPAPRCR